MAPYGAPFDPVMVTVHLVSLLALAVVGYLFARRVFTERLAK